MHRRSPITILLLSILIAACAAPPTPTVVPAQTKVNQVPLPPSNETKVADLKEYVPSDPSLVGTTGRAQLITFFASKSAESQQLRPYLFELQDEYGFLVDFIYLDIDAANTKAMQNQLTFTGSRPTIIFMDANGKEQGRMVGAHSKTEISDKLDELVAVG